MDQARAHATRALRLAATGRGRRGSAQHLAWILLADGMIDIAEPVRVALQHGFVKLEIRRLEDKERNAGQLSIPSNIGRDQRSLRQRADQRAARAMKASRQPEGSR